MPLTSLNYDILSNICSFLKTRRSLLDLALTCRTLHSVVIPAILYERLEFPHRLDNPASLGRFQSFIDAIHTADSMIADAVRHIEVRGVESLRSFWADSVPLMRNLRSVAIPEWYTLFPPLTLKQLSAMPRLHTLLLDHWDCDLHGLDPLRELSGLRNLSIFLGYTLEITLGSALGAILLNSRDTLTKLSLYNFEWQLPTHSANFGEIVWPNVVALCMWIVEDLEGPSDDRNFTHHFPSVRQFDCESYGLCSNVAGRPCNASFIARLSSLDARFDLVKLAKDVGAPLQRVVIHEPDEHVELSSYLSPDIMSVRFQHRRTVAPFRQLEQLVTACPKVAYLAVACKELLTSSLNYADTKVSLGASSYRTNIT